MPGGDPDTPSAPVAATPIEKVDACLGASTKANQYPVGGIYHYKMVSPCLVDAINLKTNESCSSVAECGNTGILMKSYALKSFENYKSEMVLGVAKDGHMLLGPYDDNGLHFDCRTYDQCGGTYSSDGSYVYIFSERYPYSMNCFGPAQPQTYVPSCTSDPC
jgi:hypothetical protein